MLGLECWRWKEEEEVVSRPPWGQSDQMSRRVVLGSSATSAFTINSVEIERTRSCLLTRFSLETVRRDCAVSVLKAGGVRIGGEGSVISLGRRDGTINCKSDRGGKRKTDIDGFGVFRLGSCLSPQTNERKISINGVERVQQSHQKQKVQYEARTSKQRGRRYLIRRGVK